MAATKKLQRLIDRCVSASNAGFAAQTALHQYCEDQYGYNSGDVDADEIIDGVFAANGFCSGMSAREFDEIMRRSSARDTPRG